VEIGMISQEVQMCSWANFYQRLANEAKERAARGSNPWLRYNFEAGAKVWSRLAAWAEFRAS
jgi:hypothetical protein